MKPKSLTILRGVLELIATHRGTEAVTSELVPRIPISSRPQRTEIPVC